MGIEPRFDHIEHQKQCSNAFKFDNSNLTIMQNWCMRHNSCTQENFQFTVLFSIFSSFEFLLFDNRCGICILANTKERIQEQAKVQITIQSITRGWITLQKDAQICIKLYQHINKMLLHCIPSYWVKEQSVWNIVQQSS